MDIYTVSPFGHRNLLNLLSAEEHLEWEIYKECGVVNGLHTILCGNYCNQTVFDV